MWPAPAQFVAASPAAVGLSISVKLLLPFMGGPTLDSVLPVSQVGHTWPGPPPNTPASSLGHLEANSSLHPQTLSHAGLLMLSVLLEKVIAHTALKLGLVFRDPGCCSLQAEVLVCSKGGGGLLRERMALVRELWAAGVKALFLQATNPSMKDHYEYANAHAISWFAVIEKTTFAAADVVKVSLEILQFSQFTTHADHEQLLKRYSCIPVCVLTPLEVEVKLISVSFQAPLS